MFRIAIPNGIAQSIWGMSALVYVTKGPEFITVIEQCMGAGDTQAADYYFRKLLKITLLFSLVWNGLIFAVMPILMHFNLGTYLRCGKRPLSIY